MKEKLAGSGSVFCFLWVLLLVSGVRAQQPESEADRAYQLSVEGTLERLKRRLEAAEKEINYTIRKYKQEQAQAQAKGGISPEKLEQMVQQLEKRVEELTRQKVDEQMGDIGKRLETIEGDIEQMLGRQDQLAEQVKKNKLQWTGGFRVTANSFHLLDSSTVSTPDHLELVLDDFGQPIYDPLTGSVRVVPVYREEKRNIDKWYGNNWVQRLFLKMSFDITDKLRFFGRLAVLKYMNELKPHSVSLDMHSTRYPRDPILRIERAYIDWVITDWLVFSAGRIASAEGPPAELKENTVRSATWGVQMVEAEMETIMLTVHFDSFISGLDNFNLRLFYMPFTQHTDFQLSDNLRLFKHEPGFNEMHVFGGMFEITIPGMTDNIIQMGAAYIPAFTPRKVPVYVPHLDLSIAPSGSTSDTLGKYAMFTSLMEFTDIASSGLDLFLGYHMTMLQPSDGRILYDIPVSLPIVHPVTGPTGTTFKGTSKLAIGLASYEEGPDSTNFGHLIIAGARWTLPFWEKLRTRVGAEMNYGSKYHVSWSSPSDLLVNRLATKGLGWEVYVIQELIAGNLFARVGYLQIHRNYDGLYLGPTTAVDQTLSNTYVLVDAHW